jgi:hypothetical protein
MAAPDDVPPHGRHRQQPATFSSATSQPVRVGAVSLQEPRVPAGSHARGQPEQDAPSAGRPDQAGLLDRLLAARGWPLAVILAVQVGLSLRLVWRSSAFLDEALYLSVGHLELAHYTHGAPMPLVSSYMSGSPLVYPPLAAVADEIGGLAGARLLSLAFILVATFLLHGVSKRLMASRTAASFAAAAFAGVASAQYLSAFATYDAMALCLLALATWLGVRALDERPAVRYILLSAGGVAIMLADAAKYAAAIFNPVVLAVVCLAAWRAHGRKAGLDACGVMVLAAAVPLAVGYDLAGVSFEQGITSTTLARASSTDSISAVITLSAQATAIVAVLAVLGAALLTLRRGARITVALAWVLVAAEFLAPAEQARIHTTTSLFKHVGYGAWFACVVAGYLLAEWAAELSRWMGARRARSGAAAAARGRPTWALSMSMVAVILAGAAGLTVADVQYGDWPEARPMIAALTRHLQPGGYYLAEEPAVVTYYLRKRVPFLRVDSTFFFSYPDRATGQELANGPAYDLAIRQRYFAAVILRFGSTYAVDELVVKDMEADRDYRLAASVPYMTSYGPGVYQIWVRTPRHAPGRAASRHKNARKHHKPSSP